MTPNEKTITLGDDIALQIERIVAAGRDIGEIVEATGHTLESLLRGLTSEELMELLQSVRDDLATDRIDRDSTQLRELYRIASTHPLYRFFLPEHRERLGEHLKAYSQYIDPTTDDRATRAEANTTSNEADEVREVDGRAAQANFDPHRLAKAMLLSELFPEHDDEPRLERYLLLKRLGTGGMSDVYGAYDPQVGRMVAVKVLRPGLRDHVVSSERLLRAARIMANLPHPNIVQVYDSGQIDGLAFVVMELVEGTSLRKWLEAQPRWETILEKFIAAAQGLVAVHEAGFILRDFKPDNVLIDREGRARLFDFDLCRPRDATSSREDVPLKPEAWPALGPLSELTMSGLIRGTPAYMSPEQMVGGHLDARSDQFSFCVALYEALYGERPFHGESFGSLRKSILSGEVPWPPRHSDVPRQIWRVLSRGLAVDLSARFPTMHELLMALERAAERRHQRRYHWAAAAGFLAAGASLASGAMSAQDSSSYGMFFQVFALLAAALGGLSLGAALQRRSRLSSTSSAPQNSAPKPKEGDKPDAE
jgi:hypothetical protein